MTDFKTQLMQVFDFTEEDLVANRNGKVTEGQITRTRASQQKVWLFAAMALGSISAVIMLIMILQFMSNGSLSLLTMLLIGVPLTSVEGIALWVLMRQQQQTIEQLQTASVHALKGEILLSPRNKRAADHLTISKKHFILKPKQFQVLMAHKETAPKARYHVYYVAGINKMLSLEVIPTDA